MMLFIQCNFIIKNYEKNINFLRKFFKRKQKLYIDEKVFKYYAQVFLVDFRFEYKDKIMQNVYSNFWFRKRLLNV